MSPSLVLTVGLPGSGKSTFCRALAARTGATVLESDALRGLLFHQPGHSVEESRQLFRVIYAAAEVLLQEGTSVIIDATNLRERDRRPAYALSQATGARLLLVHFSAPESVIAARLAGRVAGENPDDCSTAGMAVYLRMRETQEPLAREHMQIDTSDAVATAQALDTLAGTLRAADN